MSTRYALSPIPENAVALPSSTENARIKVVVRIRPLNARDISRGNKAIVQEASVDRQSIHIFDPACFAASAEMSSVDMACWTKTFSFDRIMWSLNKSSSNYASQETVFEELGRPIVKWIVEGYNCCVLAYGQTGTGKTYTMTGDIQGDPSGYGLVPRICYSLFDELDQVAEDGSDVSTTLSYMEIYNESVRDLLSPSNTGALRVREHPQQGVFVSSLTTIKVTCFDDVMSLIAIGDKNRTVASTNANTHSSRSHAIVSLTVIQRKRSTPKNGLPTTGLEQKVCRVNLVDLAGSERVTFSGAKGDRLKEANHINLSLSVLGDVIKSLGDLKGKPRGHIPYRNSTLTLLLKESLGGNSHAVMVTTISPSSMDYEETLSTLKYADRAKRVRMRVEANITSGLLATDSSAVELVPILQAEVRKLRLMLAAQQKEQTVSSQAVSLLDTAATVNATANPATSAVIEEMKERVRELENQLAERERLIESLEVLRVEQRLTGERPPSESRRNSEGAGMSTGGTAKDNKYIEDNNATRSVDAQVLFSNDCVDTAVAALQNPSDLVSDDGVGDDALNTSVQSDVSTSDISNSSKLFQHLRQRGSNDSLVLQESLSASLRDSHLNGSGQKNSGSKSSSSGNGAIWIPKVGESSPPRGPKTSSQPVVVLADDAVDITLPRVINLNQDPLFSECLVYYLPEGVAVAGSKEAHADILLTGPDIIDRHCLIHQIKGDVWLQALNDASVFVNGNLIPATTTRMSQSGYVGGVQLKHFDRIAFGRFHLFRFEAKGHLSSVTAREVNHKAAHSSASFFAGTEAIAVIGNGAITGAPGWEFAQEELLRKNNSMMQLRPGVNHSLEASAPSATSLVQLSNVAGILNPVSASASLYNPQPPLPKRSGSPTVASIRSLAETTPKSAELPAGNDAAVLDVVASVAASSGGLHKDFRKIVRDLRAEEEQFGSDSQVRESGKASKQSSIVQAPVSSTRTPTTSGMKRGGTGAKGVSRSSSGFPPIPLTSATAGVSSISSYSSSHLKHDGPAAAPHEVFEREAKALQEELAMMQKTLEDRMQRYQHLAAGKLR